MAFAKIDICNKALGRLGLKPIASLSENTQAAIRINVVYDLCRTSALRDFGWGFAKRIDTLAQISGETVVGWTYLYAYPSGCVLIQNVFSDITVTNPLPIEHKIVNSPTSFQRCIACNFSPAYIEFVRDIDDPSQYDSDFIEQLALKLASEVCFVLTGDKSNAAALRTEYLQTASEAQRKSATERNVNQNRTSSYETARD